MKIFIGIKEIAGYGINLERGFKQLGYECDFYSFVEHPFNYGHEKNFFIKSIQKCYSRIPSIDSRFIKICLLGLLQIAKIFFMFYSLVKYDVFIFLCSTTFLHKQLDLPILCLWGKKIIILENGSDMRPPYINGAVDISIEAMVKDTAKYKKKAMRLERYADYIVSFSPIMHFHCKPAISVFAIGIPQIVQDEESKTENEVVTIVHAPSNPRAKGTEYIRKLINELKGDGYRIKYIELQGQNNSVVLDTIKKCDFVIDQVYSDSPLAGFAAEAASMGKPALVAGEYAAYIKEDVPHEFIPPSEYVELKDLKKSAIRLIEDASYRKKLGNDARDYIRKYWSADAVAVKYMKLINDEVPNSWFINPNHIPYIYGGFAPIKKIKKNIKEIVIRYGIEALCVDDKPKIKNEFLKMVREE